MRINRERVALVVAALFGIVFLVLFADFIASGRHRLRMESPAVIGLEAHSIHVPLALIALARSHDFRSHGQCARLIREAGLDKTWFAVTMRERRDDGGMSDQTRLIRPDERASQFEYTLPVLQALSGRPTTLMARYYGKAKIHIIPERLMFREPHEAYEELQELEAAIP